MSYQFWLSDEQEQLVREWVATLSPEPASAIAGRLKYEFTPTSIGLVAIVTDTVTNRFVDVSDYYEW